jgi:nucleoside-diphosphate-sugar epimerase
VQIKRVVDRPTVVIVDANWGPGGLNLQDGDIPQGTTKEFGFKPLVGLREGIRSAVAWYRERGMLAP